jgi:hypothetical protein
LTKKPSYATLQGHPKAAILDDFEMISSKLQAIGGFYLLSSIWELFSRHG